MAKLAQKVNHLERALSHVGRKFELLIVSELLERKGQGVRFNQLLAGIPALTPRTLSLRLKSLEQKRMVSKNIVLGTPIKTEYRLTEKGESLRAAVEMLQLWGQKQA